LVPGGKTEKGPASAAVARTTWVEGRGKTGEAVDEIPFLPSERTKGKENAMVVKVFITRKIKAENLGEAVRLLSRVRYRAMKAKGYIMSETLNRFGDPTEVMVSSMWQSIDYWEKWQKSKQRIELSKEFSTMIIGSEKIDVFEMGTIQDFISYE
jgi:heme-degrading monooxygenase HmoA